jgi:PLP dependent protein
MTIADNLAGVRQKIDAACARVGRSPESVTLVAVSKRKPVADILAAINAGVRHLGENRVEEVPSKREAVLASTNVPVRWHMVGPVQSRKVRYVPRLFDVLEAVDSLKVAQKLSRLIETGKLPPFESFIQVNVSGEESKGGLQAGGWQDDPAVLDAVVTTARQIITLPGLAVRGLMTLAPYVDDPEATRPVFASLYALREHLRQETGADLPDLSMGMTNDYPVAIEEGATVIRIGRAIFGERVP